MTGSPVGSDGGPRTGQVLGERYQIEAKLGADPFTLDYRALDQETEQPVLVRVVEPKHLPASEARNTARRLSRLVGAGGEYLSALLDADCDGVFLFVVEPLAVGATLRDVMRARAARYDILSPAEILPVTARLAAALAAVPPPFRHGDVRADRIVIEPEAFALTCPFLVPALPTEVLSSILETDPRLARQFAPEVTSGNAGEAADRYGVASIVFEALTGRLPERGAPSASELGDIGTALQALLAPDPEARPESLDSLIEVLAARAELPVPELEPGAFKRPRRLSVRRKSETGLPTVRDTEELSAEDTEPRPAKDAPESASSRRPTVQVTRGLRDTIEMSHAPELAPPDGDDAEESENTRRVVRAEATSPPKARVIPGASADGTQELDALSIIEETPIEQQAEAPAAPAEARPTKKDESDGDLDPRLVRAALGVEMSPSSAPRARSTPPPSLASAPAAAAAPRPMPAPAPVPAPAPMPAPAPAAAPLAVRARSAKPRHDTLELSPADIEMIEREADKLPAPEPADDPSLVEEARERARTVPLPGRARAQPAILTTPADPRPPQQQRAVPAPAGYGPPRAEPPQPLAPVTHTPLPKRSVRRDTWILEPDERNLPPVPVPRRRTSSKWILLIAAVIGLIIIATGWFIAEQRRSNIERERRLQERFEQLRSTE